jgi:hypothetical protein
MLTERRERFPLYALSLTRPEALPMSFPRSSGEQAKMREPELQKALRTMLAERFAAQAGIEYATASKDVRSRYRSIATRAIFTESEIDQAKAFINESAGRGRSRLGTPHRA